MPNTPRRRRGTLVGRRRRRRTIVKSRSSDPLSGFEFSSPRNSRREANIYRRASKKKRSTKRKRRRKTKRKQRGGGGFSEPQPLPDVEAISKLEAQKEADKGAIDKLTVMKHDGKTIKRRIGQRLFNVVSPFVKLSGILTGAAAFLLDAGFIFAVAGSGPAIILPFTVAEAGLLGYSGLTHFGIKYGKGKIEIDQESRENASQAVKKLLRDDNSELLKLLLQPLEILRELNADNEVPDEQSRILSEYYYKLIRNAYNEQASLRRNDQKPLKEFRASFVYEREEAALMLCEYMYHNRRALTHLLKAFQKTPSQEHKDEPHPDFDQMREAIHQMFVEKYGEDVFRQVLSQPEVQFIKTIPLEGNPQNPITRNPKSSYAMPVTTFRGTAEV